MRHFSGSELDCGDKDTVQSNIEMPVGIGLALGTKNYVQVRIENTSNWLQSSAYGPDVCPDLYSGTRRKIPEKSQNVHFSLFIELV